MSVVAHMAKPAAVCPYCRSTDIVTDYAAGDEICRTCAAVINERLVCGHCRPEIIWFESCSHFCSRHVVHGVVCGQH